MPTGADHLVLVTGAAGRLGRALCHGILSSGYRVRMLDRTDPTDELKHKGTVFRGEITDVGLVAEAMAGVDSVVHLAGSPNSERWDVIRDSNIDGTYRIFAGAADANVRRIVYASSIQAFGYHHHSDFPNLTSYRPSGLYGLSKMFGEGLLQYLADHLEMTAMSLRIGSFKPAPTNARDLTTWLSPGDMVRLVEACLRVERLGFHAMWGFSDIRRVALDRAPWDAIGYVPRDNPEDYIEALQRAGVDTEAGSEWERIGGEKASHRLKWPRPGSA